MAGLGGQAALAFPLGGEGLAATAKPWFVNLYPPPGTANVSQLEPVQLSIRDVETTVDLGTVEVAVGYAAVYSHAEDYFDYLPRTIRDSIFAPTYVGDPTIARQGDGILIQKTSNYPQKSVYCTSIDVSGQFRPSGLVVATINPQIEDVPPLATGPMNASIFPGIMPLPWMNSEFYAVSGVLALEHGPRNTALYVFFINSGTVNAPHPQLRICGPWTEGSSNPDFLVNYDWFGSHKYFLLWNEYTGEAEVFADVNGVTTRIYHLPFLNPITGELTFSQFVPGSNNYQKHAGSLDFTAVYGQEGRSGSRMVVSSIAVTSDVGCPVRGISLQGDWNVKRLGAEMVYLNEGVDPRHPPASPWFDTPSYVLPSPDPAGVKAVVGGVFRQSKVVLDKHSPAKSLSVYREEPGLLRSVTPPAVPPPYTPDGFMLESKFFATDVLLQGAGTGMGYLIYDGQTVYDLGLFDDSQSKVFGLLQKNGDPLNVTHRYLPVPPVDWSSPVGFRFTVDPRRNRIELYNQQSYLTPAMSLTFSRGVLPSGSDYGLLGRTPFIAFGHPGAYATLGSFDLYNLKYSHVYQAWEARTERDPTAATPPFTVDGDGTSTTMANPLVIRCDSTSGQLRRFYRTAEFDVERGVIVEAHLQITSYRPRSRTGAYLIIEDGIVAYMLGFVDTDAGKFVCVSLLHDLVGFTEYPGFEGISAKTSFLFDWTQEHRYRFERRPYDGLYVYVDYEDKPRLAIKDADAVGYPTMRPDLPQVPLVGFGHFSSEGGSSSWRYFRTFCSTGYEVSARKGESDQALTETLFGTEAVVVAHATDED